MAGTFKGRARAAQPALVNGAMGLVWAPGGRPRVVFGFLTISFIQSLRAGQGPSWMSDAYKNIITETGFWTFMGAYVLDAKYFNGAVFGETRPEMQHMLTCTAKLSCF